MSRCIARTKDLERCRNDAEGGGIFCRRHRWWWLITFFGSLVVVTTVGANISQMFDVTFPGFTKTLPPILVTETATIPVTSVEKTSTPTVGPVLDLTSTETKLPPPTLIAELLCSENIFSHPWRLEASGVPDEDSKDFSDQYILKNMDILRVSYDLHGLVAQEGERKNDSVIVFNQPNWFGVSLSNYGENGLDGIQTVDIPIIDFRELPNPEQNILGGRHLDLTEPITSIRARFWHRDYFLVEIFEIQFCRFP